MHGKLPGTDAANRKVTILFLVVFMISAGLRLALVRYNREANDNHMVAVQAILRTNHLPTKQDCDECFQPKLFYLTVAFALRTAGMAGEAPLYSSPYYRQVLVAELVNFAAGLLTIAIAWIFVRRLPIRSGMLRLLAFALLALNPVLIGINSQATNDTFAILFSTLALFGACRFFRREKFGTYLLILLFASLAISSKSNTLVTAIAIVLALFARAWSVRERRSAALGYAIAFLVAVPGIALMNPLNQWITNIREYGTPLTISLDPEPFPNFFEEQASRARPGILSIQDGFFTFKFVELMKYPRLVNSHEGYPPHRTSFWTLLYAGAHSVHYPDYPPSWSTQGEDGFTVSRLIFLLALLPTFLMLAGAIMEAVFIIRSLGRRNLADLSERSFGLFVLVFAGYLGFVGLYALFYRDFSFMKAIFLYPGLLAFPLFFAQAAEWLYGRLSRRMRWCIPLLNGSMVVLLGLYLLDVATLIARIRAMRS